MTKIKHPNQPVPAFCVGITGHRPNRLGKADLAKLSDRVHHILAVIKDSVLDHCASNRGPGKNAEPILQAFSPLAEGADRLFAEQAVDLGYHLCCPIPFEQKEYEKDFEPPRALETDSLVWFRGFMKKAKARKVITTIELDGDRSHADAAYRAAGRLVLNASNILMAIWDGERLERPGGTEETMGEALRQRVPIVWIDARSPHDWNVIDKMKKMPAADPGRRAIPASLGENPLKELRSVIENLTANR